MRPFAKSVDRTQTPAYLPAVAEEVPTYGKQRAYAEMLDSGELTEEQADIIVENLAANGGRCSGCCVMACTLTDFWILGRRTRGSTGLGSGISAALLRAYVAHLFARNMDFRGELEN